MRWWIRIGAFGTVVGLFVAGQVRLRRKARRNRRELQCLSDYMLEDVGLSRSEIA